MAATVESDLRSLLTYYGENPDSPESPKPEDFFGLVLSFSSSIRWYTKVPYGYRKEEPVFFAKPEMALQ